MGTGQNDQLVERKPLMSWMLYFVLFGLLLLLYGAQLVGIDRLSTIDRLTTPALGVSGTLGAVAMVRCAWTYFRSIKTDTGLAYWKPARRRDSYGLWVFTGIGSSAVVGLVAAALCFYSLGSLAPYLPGKNVIFHATVLKVETDTSRKRLCNLDLEFSREGMNENKMVCVDPMVGPPLGPKDLKADEPVDVSAHVTAFGTAVLALRRHLS
jgi:hypothetical protein